MATRSGTQSTSRAASGWDYIVVGLIVGVVLGAIAAVVNWRTGMHFDGVLSFAVFFGLGFWLGPRIWL